MPWDWSQIKNGVITGGGGGGGGTKRKGDTKSFEVVFNYGLKL